MLARASDDQRAKWRPLLELGQLWAAGDYARTEAYYRAAHDRARALNDPAILAEGLHSLVIGTSKSTIRSSASRVSTRPWRSSGGFQTGRRRTAQARARGPRALG